MTLRAPALRRLHLGLWITAAAFWVAALGAERIQTKSVACDLSSGRSVFGEAAWSWLPPGRTCTWVLDGLTIVDGPGVERLVLPVLLGLWLFAVISLGRGGRRSIDSATG